MNADEARCVGEMTGVPVRKYKGIEHFDPRLFLEAPLIRVGRAERRGNWTRSEDRAYKKKGEDFRLLPFPSAIFADFGHIFHVVRIRQVRALVSAFPLKP